MCIHETTKFMLFFPEVFQKLLMTGIAALENSVLEFF